MQKSVSDREAALLEIVLPKEKYGIQIREQYERSYHENLPFGSLYTTLTRMEDKGFLVTRMGETVAARNGHRRKYYKITSDGRAALDQYRAWLNATRSRLGLAGEGLA